MLEIFDFTPQQPAGEVKWNRVGLTHISVDVKTSYKWYEELRKKGVEIVSEVQESKHGHTFFFAKDCDGNLIELIDLKYRYPLLRYLGWLGGWIFRRVMYRKHYVEVTLSPLVEISSQTDQVWEVLTVTRDGLIDFNYFGRAYPSTEIPAGSFIEGWSQLPRRLNLFAAQ